MGNNVYDVAATWVLENSNRSDYATHEEFVLALASHFEKAAHHIGDCFSDTAWWAGQEGVDQDDLEAAIVALVCTEADEIKKQSKDD